MEADWRSSGTESTLTPNHNSQDSNCSPSQSNAATSSSNHSSTTPSTEPSSSHTLSARPRRPSQTPRNNLDSGEQETYHIVTLLETPEHHTAMTALRTKYFPAHLNKLEAHIALFRALPSSARHIWERDIRTVTQNWPRIAAAVRGQRHDRFSDADQEHGYGFEIRVQGADAHRMKAGVLVNVRKDCGGAEAKAVHKYLREKWRLVDRDMFLSEQDRGGFRAHYTIMNKVQDQAVIEKCMVELLDWPGSCGRVRGLSVWKYEDGGEGGRSGTWTWEKDFCFGSVGSES